MTVSGKDHQQGPFSTPWWEKAVSWIQDNGGFINDNIFVCADSRELMVREDVAKHAVLMKIPLSCLVSHESIRSTKIGMKLSFCIFSLSGKLYSDQQDLLFALALANQIEHGGGSEYLESLPPSSAFDFLPRRWNSKQKTLLNGSTFVERVEKATLGINQDFQLLSTAWNDINDSPFCSFENFDTMMAVVSSRAFAGMSSSGNDQDIAMIPLLDMCNHQRGSGRAGKKNVAYKRQESAVHATAHEQIKAGTALQITYGAKGNAQLLFNYGFAIYNNVEPDGSSNDVVEVQLHGRIVELRTGPKSYTFGCFSRAVENFHKQDENAIECEGPGDLEDFLNECDKNPGVCGIIEDDDEEEDEGEGDEAELLIKGEIEAVKAMEKALFSARNRYSLEGMNLRRAINWSCSAERYAGILIHSEVRTIQFYELACRRIIEKLANTKDRDFRWRVALDENDEILLQLQARELADTFVRIRFPSY